MSPPTAPLPVVVGLLACGAFAALTTVNHEPGLAVAVTALLLGAVVCAARPTKPTLASLSAGGLALALASTVLFVDAGWVLAFNLTYALGLGSYALVGGATLTEVPRACFRFLAKLPDGAVVAFSPFARVAKPALERRAHPYARGVLLGSVLLLVFGGLFVSADPAFKELTSSVLTPNVGGWGLLRRVVVLLFVMMLGGAYIAASRRYAGPLERNEGDPPAAGSGSHRLGDWAIPLVVLDLLFAGFVAVQLAVLFGGRRHVLETAGLSFAEYARQGFFQLVLVSALTLIVVGVAVHRSDTTVRGHRLLLKILLGILCVLTLVILASALKRLALYEETYGATRLRISVHATILWLGGIFVMVLVAGAVWKATWLARTALYFTAAGLLAFTAINPEAVIARENIERYERTGEIDVAYLDTLSADVVPQLSTLPEPVRGCALDHQDDYPYDSSLWAFNFSRDRAAELLSTSQPGVCPYSGAFLGN